MWNDAQGLNRISDMLFGASALLVLLGGLYYLINLPRFTMTVVQLKSAPVRVDAVQVEQAVHGVLHGNFFTMDLEQSRRALEALPWVRHASLRRHFPWRLDVELEEQVAFAHWNEDRLVNTYGEVFDANSNATLPDFNGPDDAASSEVMQAFTAFNRMLQPTGMQAERISLSPRRAWQLRLGGGTVLELGRTDMAQRLARFVAVYPDSLALIKQPLRYVDLRYRNGFAVHMLDGKV